MGYIRHHAIVVTSYFDKDIEKAQKKAKEIFEGNVVSEILTSPINGYVTFFIAPDGSKEGWNESNIGDNCRKKFIKWMDKRAYEDGSNSLNYAELFYGDDGGDCEIVKHNGYN